MRLNVAPPLSPYRSREGVGAVNAAGAPPPRTEETTKMSAFATRFLRDESGATAIEYGLIVALIAVVIITAVTTLGTKLDAAFGSINSKLP